MGKRYMNSRSDFFLPVGKKADALAALVALFSHAVAHIETLQDALALGAFETTEDDEGNIDDLFLATESFDPEDIDALQAIAPFVRAGSYVMVIDEDAEQFAWVFREHPETHVVEVAEETVIPVLESDYERMRATVSSNGPERPSAVAAGSLRVHDDAECEGP